MTRALFLILGLLGASSAVAAPAPLGPEARISASLRADLARAELPRGTTFGTGIMRPADGVVRVVVETAGDPAELAGRLAEHGDVELFVRGRVQMTAKVVDVVALAALPGVHRVRYPHVPRPKAVSQGLSLHGADAYQAAGYDGSGTHVGVLDVGFDGWDALPNDLPVFGAGAVSWAPSIGGPGSNVHGTACAEIIHDLAPGAALSLANFGTGVEFDSQLQWLVDNGVDVVSASIGWDNIYPIDGTGWYAQVVDYYHSQGILYVAAAGNEGQQYWVGPWSDADSDGNHDFLANASQNTLVLWDNTGYPEWEITDPIWVTARWTEPFGGSSFDLILDVYIADPADPTTVVTALATGDEVQDGAGDPLERASYTATLPADQLIVARLSKYAPSQAAPAGLWVKVHAGASLPVEYQVRAGSLSTPSDANNALAVGAVQQNDLYIAPYSSEGPTDDGRDKPDVFGISHVDTESYGPWVSDPMEPGFNGTSAATPHVSALAALLLDETPSLTNNALWGALVGNVDTTAIQGGGDTAGSGLVNLGAPLGDDDDDTVDDDDTADDDDAADGGDVEPNNSTSDASPVACGQEITGYADDEDWYFVDMLSDGELSVLLNWAAGPDLDLYLYDGGLAVLDSSEQVNTASESVSADVLAGTFYLRVVPYTGAGSYWFEPQCTTVGPDDDDAGPDDDDATDDDDAADDDDDDDAADDDDDDATLALPDDDDADPAPEEGDGCQSCASSLGGGGGLWLALGPLLVVRRRR